MDLIRLIMACTTTVSMNVLWNGEVTDDFAPTRGIRQGDPISPQIFVLCIDRLSHGIRKAVNDGDWKPVQLSRNGTPLTHLFFADDLLLLAKASTIQVKVLSSVLDSFRYSSGAKVNDTKTQVFFSKNVSHKEANNIGTLASTQACPSSIHASQKRPIKILLRRWTRGYRVGMRFISPSQVE